VAARPAFAAVALLLLGLFDGPDLGLSRARLGRMSAGHFVRRESAGVVGTAGSA
jgi:hypothetical protein